MRKYLNILVKINGLTDDHQRHCSNHHDHRLNEIRPDYGSQAP